MSSTDEDLTPNKQSEDLTPEQKGRPQNKKAAAVSRGGLSLLYV
jgi:hypothetical protein